MKILSNTSKGYLTMNIKDLVKFNKRKEAKTEKKNNEIIRYNDFFRDISPVRGYSFASDYFRVDEGYGTILTVVYDELADLNLPTFWGILFIPQGLDPDVSVRRLTAVDRKGEGWIAAHQTKSENLIGSAAQTSQDTKGTLLNQKRQEGHVAIARELNEGSSYLDVSIRFFVTAPTLNKLDDAVEKMNRQMKDRFNSVQLYPMDGEQMREFRGLYGKTITKPGKRMMFTSKEFAGYYDLVTHGIEDDTGEYIGTMTGDVNNSAILMDLDLYDSHLVLAGQNKAVTSSGTRYRKEYGVNMIATKIGFSALMNNKRVVHLVLNGSKVQNMGVDLSDITAQISMDSGDINFLELFGRREDELSLFPAHLQKIVLMYKQISRGNPEIEDIVDGLLKDVLTDYYIDKHMWVRDAQHNRERLRLVGLDHEDVPTLPDLVTYLRQRYDAEVRKNNADQDMLRSYNILVQVFRSMLEDNGDLFDTKTNPIIDQAQQSSRVVYDFSSLIHRSKDVMMAQFVNALNYSVMNLDAGDVVFLHGADYLTGDIKEFVREQFSLLRERDVRVVYIYHSIEDMIKDRSFNRFDEADYTMFGSMSANNVDAYETGIKQALPGGLKTALNHGLNHRYYLRRGFDNLLVNLDIQMGV